MGSLLDQCKYCAFLLVYFVFWLFKIFLMFIQIQKKRPLYWSDATIFGFCWFILICCFKHYKRPMGSLLDRRMCCWFLFVYILVWYIFISWIDNTLNWTGLIGADLMNAARDRKLWALRVQSSRSDDGDMTWHIFWFFFGCLKFPIIASTNLIIENTHWALLERCN